MQPSNPPNRPSFISTQQAQQAARALTSALSNPYSSGISQQQGHYGQGLHYSSHYAQAYLQASSSTPMTTPEGYTLSSTYTATPYTNTQTSKGRGGSGPSSQRGRVGQHRGGLRSLGSWYEPGNHRCTYEQCSFMGSRKSVEIHMMDRHLIYPPGWENRKRKFDWDADPSLNNGKPIPIQGTSLILETPEDINTWIAERKKRWPTSTRTEEKERKLQEAVERGEIAAVSVRSRSKKRQRTDDGLQYDRGRGRGRGLVGKRGSHLRGQGQGVNIDTSLPKKPSPLVTAAKGSDSESDSDSSSGSDIDQERDAISSKPPDVAVPETNLVYDGIKTGVESTVKLTKEDKQFEPSQSTKSQVIARRSPPQPRPPPRNPFFQRQSLLRNLLLPEIRATVSNLSQAIHFLVENDFLQDVELNPGDADNRPIEVISESENIADRMKSPQGSTEVLQEESDQLS